MPTPLLKTIIASAVTSVIVTSGVLMADNYFSIQSAKPNNKPETHTSINLLESDQAVISTVQKAEPAVASVIISKDLPVMERYFESIPFGNGFNIRLPRQRQSGTELQEVGGGTAFFISSDGLMVTNKHVVSDTSATYTVLLNDGQTLNATVVARDPITDIALLKVEGSNFPFLQIAESEAMLGQSVIAIGNALAEFRNTVSVGVISGLQRTITAGNPYAGELEQLSSILQTDAAINAGNSGGPLLDLSGNVIGMNTAVSSQGQNIGFALPASELSRAIQSYQEFGLIARPYIGVRYVRINADIAEQLSLSKDYGAFIQSNAEEGEPGVLPNSPAAKAGLKDGDLIITVDGKSLEDENTDLSNIIIRKAIGDTVLLTIIRDGKERTVKITLEEFTESLSNG